MKCAVSSQGSATRKPPPCPRFEVELSIIYSSEATHSLSSEMMERRGRAGGKGLRGDSGDIFF